VKAEPFAHYVYIPAQQTGYYVDDLDEAIDDLTNCECEVTPLFKRPADTREAEARALDAERWRFQELQIDITPYLREYHSGVLLSAEDIDAAIAKEKK
jgi:hypothetical protein